MKFIYNITKKIGRLSILILIICVLAFSAVACKKQTTKEYDIIDLKQASSELYSTLSNINLSSYKKFKSPFDLKVGRIKDAEQSFYSSDSYEENIWNEAYKVCFNANIDTQWVVSPDMYQNKINDSIARKKIPDIFEVNYEQLINLKNNDMIYDLSDVYSAEASQQIKNVIEYDELSFNSGKIDGRLYGIAKGEDSFSNANMLFVRKDWAQKLNTALPTNMAELNELAVKFTTQDPDENQKNDTYGIAFAGKEADAWCGNMQGYFAGYGAQIGAWTKNSAGEINYGSVSDGTKIALTELQKLYKQNAVAPEFVGKTSNGIASDVLLDKVGIVYGKYNMAEFPFYNTANLSADWTPMPLLSVNSNEQAKILIKNQNKKYYVVSKSFDKPELLFSMIQLDQDVYNLANNESIEKAWDLYCGGKKGDLGYSYYNLSLVNITQTNKIYSDKEIIASAVKSNNFDNIVNENLKIKAKQEFEWKQKIGDKYNHFSCYGENGAISILQKYKQTKNIVVDEAFGDYTNTQNGEWENLLKWEKIFIDCNIAQNNDIYDFTDKPFETFVSKWKEFGGTQITTEINQKYNN